MPSSRSSRTSGSASCAVAMTAPVALMELTTNSSGVFVFAA